MKRVGAPKGNQNRRKLKSPELRQAAYESYCRHLALGKSSRSFVFQSEGLSLTGKSVENMLKEDWSSIEFPAIHKEVAEAKGFGLWEQIVEDSATGKNPKANTAALQMLMRNKFGWDLRRDKIEDVDVSKLDALANFFSSIPSSPSIRERAESISFKMDESTAPEESPVKSRTPKTNFP